MVIQCVSSIYFILLTLIIQGSLSHVFLGHLGNLDLAHVFNIQSKLILLETERCDLTLLKHYGKVFKVFYVIWTGHLHLHQS